MAPSAILASTDPTTDLSPPSKRRKTNCPPAAVSPHPLRLKPLGNAFTASTNLRDISTGRFAVLPDELLIQVLGACDAESLLAIGATSKGLYAFSRCEELWKDLFIQSYTTRRKFTWHGTWFSTYLDRPATTPPITCPTLFSDVLYRPFYCSQIDLARYTSKIPQANLIPRFPDLDVHEFNEKWANKPFILTEPVKSWPGYSSWTVDALVEKYGDVKFRAEAVDWPLRSYCQYMRNNSDESPLYLFDKLFAEKTDMGGEYIIPPVFQEDFFEVLDEDRPDRKWMILGPERSGSSFHKDPNATSAWNAVVEGDKYWIMFPRDTTPPGVFVSEDMSEVTSPLSIAEWFEGFHKEARKTPGVKEGICRRGEVLHVPSGWWHLVVNLTPALAITQNFVPRKHLPSVLLFLRDQSQSISGFDCSRIKDAYTLFVDRMREAHPVILEEALIEMRKMAVGKEKRSGKWDKLVEESKSAPGGFMFDFGEEQESSGEEEEAVGDTHVEDEGNGGNDDLVG